MTDLSPETVEKLIVIARRLHDAHLSEETHGENVCEIGRLADAVIYDLPLPVEDDALVVALANAIADRRGVDPADRDAGMMSVWRMDARAVLNAYRTLATSTTASDGRGA